MSDLPRPAVSISPSIGVIITAAGASTRFGGDKLGIRLGEQSVLAHSIAAFTGRAAVTEILIALPPSLPGDSSLAREVESLRLSLPHAHVRFVPVGGTSRAHTVRNAIEALVKGCEFVAIHDAARPLVSKELIDRVFAAAYDHGSAAPAVPVTSTIKLAGPSLPSLVERTIPRSTLWAMQTPQVARRTMLLDAFARCPLPLAEVTDDVQLLELVGEQVMLVPGDDRNLKITTPLDLQLARLLLHA